MNTSLTMDRMAADTPPAPDDLAQLSARLRPRLHRYVARMAGSSLDGEDIVQEALAKAATRYDPATVRQPDAWLFRIAHNAALDFLRHRALERGLFVDLQDDDEIEALAPVDTTGAGDALERAQAATAALATFMQLPTRQRSAVILFDVLGHALDETAQLLDTNVPAVKAALHRGRTRLRELGRQASVEAPRATELAPGQHDQLQLYADRFNARDFDGLRDLLADEVRLNLPARTEARGKAQVGNYFGNYARVHDVRAEPGVIEGRPGLWMYEGGEAASPAYAVLLAWRGGQLVHILDFRYARYVVEALLPIRPPPA
ncbi:sigma-70 family RNA polymerase sigma factor [Variovorax sp. OV329]|uniref:sigma-70 family RNA polymerase sigma factor n=1 Tax=Variovorax sp. OV329 TaxID=1882825 RepID=UPI0020C861B5|nr:sigma-70 family RNA polymerase sigma factor [Variovorax sp. OV329]